MSIILNTTSAAGFRHDQFDWDPKGRILIAEASTIGYDMPRRIYDDACDVGIAIQGKRHALRFYEASRDIHGEDIGGWRFKLIPEDARAFPQLADITVLIIND